MGRKAEIQNENDDEREEKCTRKKKSPDVHAQTPKSCNCASVFMLQQFFSFGKFISI